MAPLPPSSTNRLFLDYITGGVNGVEHTLQVRYPGADRTANAAQAAVLALMNIFTNGRMRTGWRFLRARTALAGEEFTGVAPLIAGLQSFAGTNSTAYDRSLEARELTFQGRGIGSPRRVDLSIFGLGAGTPTPSTFRESVSASGFGAVIGSAVSFLNSAQCPFLAIDGTQPQWYSYANLSFNRYWTNRLRIS